MSSVFGNKKASDGSNDAGGDGGITYSLGILIILLMIFWFMCKGIGNSTDSTCNKNRKTNMRLLNNNYPLRYNAFGGRRIIGRSHVPLLNTPSSKTSERKFYDKSGDSSDSDDNVDEKQVLLGKRHLHRAGI